MKTTNTSLYYYFYIGGTLLIALLEPRKTIFYLRSPFFAWVGLYLILHLISLFRLQNGLVPGGIADSYQIEAVQFSIRNFILLPITVLFALHCGVERMVILLKLTTVIVIATILWGFFNPELFASNIQNADYIVRAAGTYGNANAAAEAAVFCILLIYRRTNPLFLTILYFLVGIAVMTTFSRSGLTIWVFVGFFLAIRNSINRYMVVGLTVVSLALGAVLLDKLESVLSDYYGNPKLAQAMIARLTFLTPDSDIEQWDPLNNEISENRAKVAIDAMNKALEHPFTGWGAFYEEEFNSKTQIAPHNIALHLWYNFGALGIVLWLWFAFLLWRSDNYRSWLKPYFIVFMLLSFVNHNLFHHVYWNVLFAFALLDTQGERKLGYANSKLGTRLWGLAASNVSLFQEKQAGKSRSRKRKKRRKSNKISF